MYKIILKAETNIGKLLRNIFLDSEKLNLVKIIFVFKKKKKLMRTKTIKASNVIAQYIKI